MISFLAQEIEKWIAEHHGERPSAIRVSQAAYDLFEFDCSFMQWIPEKSADGKSKILGISVLVDPTLTIGKIDP